MSQTSNNKSKRSFFKTSLTVITFLALALLVYFLRHQISDVIKNLKNVNTLALLLMVPIQLWNYDSYARLYRAFFAILSEKVSYKEMFRFSLELNFVNHVFPSGGVSGISYFSLRTKSLGISATKGTLAQLMKYSLIFISFQILLLVGLLSLAIAGKASNITILVSASLTTLLVVGTMIAVYILESHARIRSFLTFATKAINKAIHLVRPKAPETINISRAQETFEELHENYLIFKKNWRALKAPMRYALLANLTEVLTIYVVYIAFGEYVNIGAVILAYAVANFAGLVSVLPGGIGIYEGLMTAVLATAGVPPELSIPVTIMYRVLSMTLQLSPGYFFYHKAVRGNGFSAARSD